ncbi:hypothetical protein [Nocardia sp. CDC160]|uniref:hypothetical protein n=1 Tax=Nocardia sp. CDC160 TaxID=3112166 RepID=UPI002DBECBA2|nr:hypothetical protein [Nocardia sp. CDC160]MEC3919296.1 hypothetical protein [Nocardia sp. CDC160]
MTSKKEATRARQQAHEAMAAHRQMRMAREQANEADLTAYLLLEQQLRAAEVSYRDALAVLRRRQGDLLRQWHARGEKVADIADLTGMPVRHLNQLINANESEHRRAGTAQQSSIPLPSPDPHEGS